MMKHTPSAVGSYDYDAVPCMGAHHPATVNKGLGGVTGKTSKQPAHGAGGAGSARYPAGVKRGSGTEMHGSAPKHLNAAKGSPDKVSLRSTVPAAVNKAGGLKAPRTAR